MKKLMFMFFNAVVANTALADANQNSIAATESRDAAAAYVGASNFIVGRMARECLELLNRTATPQEFVAAWQKRNAKYYAASTAYMTFRLKDAERIGGAPLRDRALTAYLGAVRGDGEAAVQDNFKKGEKSEVCSRWIKNVESGAFDINSSSPMYGELNALVKYFE